MKSKYLIIFCLLFFIFGSISYISAQETTINEGDYIILVHGLGRTNFSMLKPAIYFKNRGYHIININYPSTEYKIQILAEEYLDKAIKKCNNKNKKIHFFTHSLGGIIVRYYLHNNYLDNLGRVVMLSPPNSGTELADIIEKFPTFRWRNGPVLEQLTTARNSLPNKLGPVNFETGIITGNRSYSILASLLLSGEDDGKVSVENAKIKNMKDFLIVNRTHTFIMNSDFVLRQAHNFFKYGKFKDDLTPQIDDLGRLQLNFIDVSE